MLRSVCATTNSQQPTTTTPQPKSQQRRTETVKSKPKQPTAKIQTVGRSVGSNQNLLTSPTSPSTHPSILTHSPTHSLTHPLTHSFTHSHPPTHPIMQSEAVSQSVNLSVRRQFAHRLAMISSIASPEQPASFTPATNEGWHELWREDEGGSVLLSWLWWLVGTSCS